MRGKRRERIEHFALFVKGLKAYYSLFFDERKVKKTTASHRLALSLMKEFPPSYKIDIDYKGTDILICDDNSRPLIACLWSKDYLTEKDKDKAKKLHSTLQPILTLAFSMFGEKDYILLYRFEKDFLEYIHINKEDFTETVIRRQTFEGASKEENQLLFSLGKNKGNK